MSKEWISKARWASLRGDYAAAGDLYRLAGEFEKALAMYRKGRNHRAAGAMALQLGDHAGASREFEHGGMPLEAAEQALKAADRERAARLFVAAGQSRRAAQIQEESGRHAAAAALYEHAGDPLRAARLYLEAREPLAASRNLDALFRGGATGATELRELDTLAVRCAQQLLAQGDPEGGARWFERAGRPGEAAKAWERAAQPQRAIRAWLAAGDPDRAVAVVEAQPHDKLDTPLAAEAFRAAGRWAEAASLFIEAGRPGDAALCLEKLGCVAEAAWAHEAAGDLPAAAGALERAGQFAEAAQLYKRTGALRAAARCFEGAGELAEAADLYLAAGDRLAAATVREKLGDIDGATELLQGAAPDPDQVFSWALLLGRLFQRKRLDSLAAEQFRRALATEPEPRLALEAVYLMARSLERMGRGREATHAYRKVVAVDVNFRDAAQRLERLEQRGTTAAKAIAARTPSPTRYVVEGEIEGRFPGSAAYARDTAMERAVVLRRYGRDLLPTARAGERVLADIRRVARLHHPAIAAIYDAGLDGEGVFVVEEHVAGRTLREVLKQDGPLDVPRAVQVLTRIAEALDYAHGLGLLARSIRPETVLIANSGEAKLIDFGIALRQADGAAPPMPYRAPEVSNNERADPSSDLFLLGVIGWEMLFGAPPPFPDPDGPKLAPPLPAAAAAVPDLLRRVVTGCLEPDRGRRIGSAQALLELLHGTNLLPGALLANRYEILRELGRGGMGTVFAAKDLVLEEPVALKVLGGSLDESTEKRFIQEIRLARQINHPNVVRVHTFERWREVRFIVMEFIDGVDLRRWSRKRQPIPLAMAVDIVAGVAGGLAAAHRLGIVHRDVKPENVLLDAEGRPHLVDFGIARQGDTHLTREGLVMGSPAYMAPEQIRGEATDQRADLYALGILAYFLVAGREPFMSDNIAEVLRLQLEVDPAPLSSVRPGVPAGLDAVVARLLAKDPARRIGSVFEFLEELGRVRASIPVITA